MNHKELAKIGAVLALAIVVALVVYVKVASPFADKLFPNTDSTL